MERSRCSAGIPLVGTLLPVAVEALSSGDVDLLSASQPLFWTVSGLIVKAKKRWHPVGGGSS